MREGERVGSGSVGNYLEGAAAFSALPRWRDHRGQELIINARDLTRPVYLWPLRPLAGATPSK